MKGMSASYLVLILLAGPAVAEEACFCLGDADDAVWYDCQTYYVGLNPNPQYECRPNPDQDRMHVEQGHTLQRYAAGEGPCTPCEVEPQELSNQMRHYDDSGSESSDAPTMNDQEKTTTVPEPGKGIDRSDRHE